MKTILLLLCCCLPLWALASPPESGNHQDSSFLGQSTSAVMPPDGLLSLELGLRNYSTVYQLDGLLKTIDQLDYFFRVEAGPRPWLQLALELPWRTWSGGQSWIPASGSGLGDGHWQAVFPGPWQDSRFQAALYTGSNIPIGSGAKGLTEDAISPRVGMAFTARFWRGVQVPEMRWHLNLGYRWNRAEDFGYGMGARGFQPWAPRYPSAESVGGDSANDQLQLRAAIEFRKKSTSLWVDFARDRFRGADLIAGKEQFSSLGMGLRWGVSEGWAVRASYLVSLMTDDPDSQWDPAFPEWVMQVGVSRQFSIGGSDRDGDHLVDRKDACPDLPEDLDGFQDQDGCPDPDNDGDGILDAVDGAPDEPEDFDGWQDEDGIPDPDNDGDGILDRWDLCPNVPEDMNGHRDDDGCPEVFLDRDGDGIADSLDGCPDEAEDLDGFEDQDGCPELDNDLDGIVDSRDGCPDQAEDYDGVEDEDGCPE